MTGGISIRRSARAPSRERSSRIERAVTSRGSAAGAGVGLRAALSRTALTEAFTLAMCASVSGTLGIAFSGARIIASSMSSRVPLSTNFFASAFTRLT